MKILDPQGRLFGKVSLLDIGAALVILLVVVGIFFFPGTSGAQIGVATKPVEIDVIVRGLSVRDPQQLFEQGLKPGGKTNRSESCQTTTENHARTSTRWIG